MWKYCENIFFLTIFPSSFFPLFFSSTHAPLIFFPYFLLSSFSLPLPPHMCPYFFSFFPNFVFFPSTSHSTPKYSTHFKPLSHPSKSLHLSFFFFDSSKANDDEDEDEDDDDEEVSAYLHLFFRLFSLFPYFLFPSNRKQSST